MAAESIAYFALVPFVSQAFIEPMIDVVSSILFYFIVIFSKNFKNIKKPDSKISFAHLLALAAIFICSIYASGVLVSETFKNNNVYMAFGIAALLFVNIFVVYIYENLNKNYQRELERKSLEKQNEFYVRQLETMRQSENDIRTIRHDMRNHIIAMTSMADDGDKVREYIANFLESSDNFKEYSKSGNIIIDSIVNYKSREAADKGIEISNKIAVPQKLNISDFDMSVILGNLLDNAVEAASKAKTEKRIWTNIYFDKNSLYMHIENSFDGVVIMEDKRYKTTHQNKSNHGLGLLSVAKTLEKYNGTMDLSHTKSLFTVKILVDGVTG